MHIFINYFISLWQLASFLSELHYRSHSELENHGADAHLVQIRIDFTLFRLILNQGLFLMFLLGLTSEN